MALRNAHIGENLFLVEGRNKTIIVDFSTEQVHSISDRASKLILRIQELDLSPELKRQLLVIKAPKLHSEAERNGLIVRFFENFGDSLFPQHSLHRHAWIELTTRCNLKCSHCYADASSERTEYLSTQTIEKLLIDLKEKNFAGVQLTGGEPTLHPAFSSVLANAMEIIPEVEVFTNLTTPVDWATKNSPKLSVATTVLGHIPSIHDQCTGVKGSFSRTISNLRKLIDAKVPTRISIVVSKKNTKHLKKIKRLLREELKFSGEIGVDAVRPIGRPAGQPVRQAPAEEKEDINSTIGLNKNDVSRNMLFNPCLAGGLCVAGTGDVYPCVFMRDSSLGTVTTESIDTIMKRLEPFWQLTLDQVRGCQECEYRYLCMDCRALAIAGHGDLYGPLDTICQRNNKKKNNKQKGEDYDKSRKL